jgi:agmatine/peptidylarginine deiminase
MQGGNLLFNGRGVALTTSRIFKDNRILFDNLLNGADPVFEAHQMVTQEFKKNCNLEEIVVLEPLRSEATRHVDMFAAFVAHNHVVVASLDRKADPVNAALLDRNAKRLENVMIDGEPLKVTRIPTPARQGKFWSTFTNVIFANDLVILPSFDDNPPAYVERAVAVYKSILPDHSIKVINTTSLKRLEGSVHCMSINVPEFAKLPPKYLSLSKSIQWVRKGTPSPKKTKPVSRANPSGDAR